MSPFAHRPALPDRAAAIARGLGCWPPLLVGLAVAADAQWPLVRQSPGNGFLWLDLAAIGCVLWAALGPGRARRSDWSTPLDGRVLSGVVLAVLHVVRLRGAEEPVQWLHQIASTGVCFYAIGARLRRESRAPDAVWPVFALLTLALGAAALGHATRGVAALEAAAAGMDRNWASQHGLAKVLGLATILCAGRASEAGARALWRVTAVVGAIATGLLLVVGGAGLRIASLATLDEPFYFGTSIVAILFLTSLARMAWTLARERPEEAGRWRATAVLFPAVIVLLLFGGTTGGEGVRAVTALAGAAVIASRVAPRAAASRPPQPASAEPPVPARAA